MGAGAFTVAQAGVSFETPGRAAAMLVVYAAVALVGAGVVALLYRMYFRDAVPEGISAIVGVSLVVVYLNTASLGTIVSGGQLELLQFEVVVFNVVALGAATVSTPVGRRLGDRVGTELFAVSGGTGIEGDVGTIVRSVGRVTPVTLPGEIDDVESYDPVTAQRKAEIADKTLFFPRGLTVAQLRERVIDRLKEDYGVGYVDLDLREDGTVEYLAVGSRAAGIGHTLAPGQVAVAVQSDPAYSASPGDTVQLWTDEGTPSQVVTAQLRATAGDIATVAVEEADAASVDGR
ncbi:MAG: potassium transporter TrkA, partial [Halobacteriota archaeon]